MANSWARPGVKCEFLGIPEGVNPDSRFIEIPVVGAVYTIRDVDADSYGEVVVRLREIRNPVVRTQEGMLERAYEAWLFRPLVSKTQEQDVELFRHLLNPTNTPEHV